MCCACCLASSPHVVLSWVQQLIHHGVITLQVVKGSGNVADIGTKYLGAPVFNKLTHAWHRRETLPKGETSQY